MNMKIIKVVDDEEKKKSVGYSVGHHDGAFPDDCDHIDIHGIIAL